MEWWGWGARGHESGMTVVMKSSKDSQGSPTVFQASNSNALRYWTDREKKQATQRTVLCHVENPTLFSRDGNIYELASSRTFDKNLPPHL
jgi:hypothetical protein